MSNAELATGYAALILADEGLEITADKLQTLTKAAGIEVESIWSSLFAKALEGKDVKDLLLNVGGMRMILCIILTLGSAGAAPAAASGAAAAGGAAPAEEKVEEKEEEKEESDEDVLSSR
jgi:large subunit ribosomal protein LP1